mgnify:CR=1 FL=1
MNNTAVNDANVEEINVDEVELVDNVIVNVRDMDQQTFKNRLIEHCDILFQKKRMGARRQKMPLARLGRSVEATIRGQSTVRESMLGMASAFATGPRSSRPRPRRRPPPRPRT